MQQHRITVKKTARYFVLGEPSPSIQHVWFICHGYGQLANYFLRSFEPLNNGHHLLIAPEGLHRFYIKGFSDRVGASWMTKEDRLDDISDYTSFLDDVYMQVMNGLPGDAKVHIVGFSQGAATAARWICMGNVKAHDLILWAGMFPPDIDHTQNARALEAVRKWVVIGDQDEFISEQQLSEQLDLFKRSGIDYELIRFNGKHEISSNALVELAGKITGEKT